MEIDLVKKWFGDEFSRFHPLLQNLHAYGGVLQGPVTVVYGKGLAGVIGRRLGGKLNLPDSGVHHLAVNISHQDDGLHWDRCFDSGKEMCSLFEPVGNIEQGYWLESTGPVAMKLTVDIDSGGWYWRCLAIHLYGLPVPRWLVPATNAYKIIENRKYRFHVEFSYPVIGTLVSYSGLLDTN